MSRQIDNPQTGEHISFLTTASESGGELLRMEFTMDPGGFVAAERLHPRQEERLRASTARSASVSRASSETPCPATRW